MVGFAFPQRAEAVLGVGDVVTDPGNTVQNTITAANSGISSANTYSLQLKEYVLDSLALVLAKQIIRQITASVVNWINSGFEGSPSFVTNPGAFFLDVADQITGDFLAKYGGPLTALCSPFSIDIRIALSFKYHPNVPKRYECTLNKIIANSKNAVKGATINGFAAGDFKQGGWPAFVTMTTEPQNNQLGAYIEADSELSVRVANAQIGKKDEINNGQGFLSWRDPACKNQVKKDNEAYSAYYASNFNNTDKNLSEDQYFASGGEAKLVQKSANDCPIKTPGTVIVSSLEDNVNGPLHELQLADELNEIVNALFAQLVTQVLTKGLSSVSGSGPSDSSSYVNQIQNEANASNASQLDSIRNEFIQSVQTYVTNTTQYKSYKDQSLNLILDVKNSYESAKACYSAKITASTTPLTPSQVSQAQSKIAEITSIENTTVAPAAATILYGATDADHKLKTLTGFQDQARAAKTVNDLNAASQQYTQMVRDGSLVKANDIVAAQEELDQIRQNVAPMKQDALRKSQECQVFPVGTN